MEKYRQLVAHLDSRVLGDILVRWGLLHCVGSNHACYVVIRDLQKKAARATWFRAAQPRTACSDRTVVDRAERSDFRLKRGISLKAGGAAPPSLPQPKHLHAGKRHVASRWLSDRHVRTGMQDGHASARKRTPMRTRADTQRWRITATAWNLTLRRRARTHTSG